MIEATEQGRSVTVAVVDDHQILADALAAVIAKEEGLEFAGWAGSCSACLELINRTCPDVLLLDINLPDGDGLNLVGELRRACADTQILVLTSLADERNLQRAIGLGANGFVAKTRPASELIKAIREAAEGEIVMPRSLLFGLLVRMAQSGGDVEQAHKHTLTPRELEILKHLANGRDAAAIAAELSIAVMTVRTHIRNIMAKLGAHSRLEAVAAALRLGIIEPPL